MATHRWILLLITTGICLCLADGKDFYCYHCVSSFKNLRNADLKDELRKLYRNTFERLSAVESVECGFSRNSSRLTKQKCEDVNSCIEVKADDYTGKPYYIRGCAEMFNPKWYVKERRNEECLSPVKGLPIRECYCNGGLCNAPNSAPLISAAQWLLATSLLLGCFIR